MKKSILFLIAFFAFSANLFAIELKNCEQYQISEPAKFRECMNKMMMNGDRAVEIQKSANQNNKVNP